MKFEKNAYADQNFSKEIIEMEEISHKKFTKCVFRWTDFTDVEVFYGSTFESCDFTYAKLNGINIASCAFLNCTFKATSFFAAKLDECRMTGSNFMEAECESIQICAGDWSYTTLQGRCLTRHRRERRSQIGTSVPRCVVWQSRRQSFVFPVRYIYPRRTPFF